MALTSEQVLSSKSFARAPELQLNRGQKRKLIVAGSLGSFLEIFDFTVYSFFAATIGQVFFNTGSPLMTLLLSSAVFATGFIMRPLGSVLIGGYCDRKGRKAGLFLAIILMGLGSAIIGFTPGYETIGIVAPFLIIIGRLIQGFSAGGQIAAAGSLLMESAPRNKRGYFVSWQFIVQGFSSFFGSLFAFVIYGYLTPEQVLSWGWRTPFIFSLLIVPVGFYIRAHIEETHKVSDNDKPHPFKIIIKNHKARIFQTILMLSPCTVITYVMVFYMPHYLEINHIIEAADRYLISVYASVLGIIATLLAGVIADKFKKRKPLLWFGYISSLITGFFSFYFIHNWPIFLVNYTIVSFFYGFLMTVTFLFMAENYEKDIRVTATGATYAITVAVFGGTSSMIVTALIDWSDKNLMAPFWYLGFSLILGMIFLYRLKEKACRE